MRILIAILFPLSVFAQLSGTYTIGGVTPDYATVKAAAAALNTSGVSGACVFNIRNGTYNDSVMFDSIDGTSAVNTITFQSETGDSTDVIIEDENSLSNTNYVIHIVGCSYMTFKKLTIQIVAPYGSYNKVVYINLEQTRTCDYISFENCVFNGNPNLATSGTGAALISTTTSSSVDYAWTHLTVKNCVLNYGNYAFYVDGDALDSWASNILIENNEINFENGGCHFGYSDSLIFRNNTVTRLSSSPNNSLTNMVELSYSQNAMFYNNIFEWQQGSADGRTYGIYITNSRDLDTSENHRVYNNFISLDASTASVSTSGHCGLYIDDTNKTFVYNNSIYIASSSTCGSACIHFQDNQGTAKGNPIVRNNILVNAGSASGLCGLSIEETDETQWIDSDYNDFHIGDDTYTVRVGISTGTTYYTLAGWRVLESEDANSLELDPQYTSTTDLHVANTGLAGQGEHIGWITTDIDGDARANPPYIGADEEPAAPPLIQLPLLNGTGKGILYNNNWIKE